MGDFEMDFNPFPVGKLGIITMRGCEEMTSQLDQYLKEVRDVNPNYTFLIETNCPRFSNGEAKGILKNSVRGYDIFIICDILNYGVTYNMYGMTVPMSPDDHYQDLKRIIAAMGGKARRITVVMPILYASRQDKRSTRESLDCAIALQELVAMGVDNIITFDAHEPRVQNAIPLSGFENANAYYQMVKALLNQAPDLKIDKNNCMIVSPDEGAMGRCIYYSEALGLDLGMFYKRRDYNTLVNGRNPIIEHAFLGGVVEGKDIIIADDMIASGESVFDVARQLKTRGAKRVYVFSTFGLFVEGLARFDKEYENGLIERVFTTNLIYRTPALRERLWYAEVDMSKYIAKLIHTLNFDRTISELLNPLKRIEVIKRQHIEKQNES